MGRTGAQILNLGGGTRAASLGDAFSAVNGDVTAPLWNPSGLSGITNLQATLSYKDYSQLFGEASDGLYYAFFAGATHLENIGTVAATLQVQGQGKIAITTNSPEVIREEDLGTNWVMTTSYADQLTDNLAAVSVVKSSASDWLNMVAAPTPSTLDCNTIYNNDYLFQFVWVLPCKTGEIQRKKKRETETRKQKMK